MRWASARCALPLKTTMSRKGTPGGWVSGNEVWGEPSPRSRAVVSRARGVPHGGQLPHLGSDHERESGMTVRRVMGIETEYGISVPGDPAANPMILSGQVVNA